MDNELLRVWQLLHELSDQLNHNQKISTALQSQAHALKTEAASTSSGTSLRRFNTDISTELFDSELERVNAQIIIENQTLQHENKQLDLLLNEHETTMDTIMSKFRNHALAAQQHELTLTRHYEILLMSRDPTMSDDLVTAAAMSRSIQRLAFCIRNLIRSMAGDNPEAPTYIGGSESDYDPTLDSLEPVDLLALLDTLDGLNSGYPGSDGRQDWVIERESEITRLQAENEELRRMLGIDPASIENSDVDMDAELARMDAPRHPELSERTNNNAQNIHNHQGSGDRWEVRPSYWDASNGDHGNNGGNAPQPFLVSPQNQQSQQPNQVGGAPLQRAIELPGGLRLVQGRRSGIFGASQQRGAFGGGVGRGVSALSVPITPPSNLWNNLPASPAPQSLPVSERPWQPSSSNLDLNR